MLMSWNRSCLYLYNEPWPDDSVHQEVAGSIPRQGIYQGWGFNPVEACMEALDQCFSHITFLSLTVPLSLSLSLSLFLSLKSMSMSSGEDKK